MIRDFPKKKDEEGRSARTQETYRRNLNSFYDFLDDEKTVTQDSLLQWKEAMIREGYAEATVTSRISTVNSFYNYLGRRNWQIVDGKAATPLEKQELTRNEYLALLKEAKEQENIQLYLLVKVLACTDLTPSNMPVCWNRKRLLLVGRSSKGNRTIKHRKTERTQDMTQEKERTSLTHKILTLVGIVMCVILTPILIINCTLLIRSYTNSDEVPTVGGMAPMIVLTNSMEPLFNGGDLIFVRTAEAEDIQAGDVITFFDPAGNGTSVVTHRVLEVLNQNGDLEFTTKGDANNAEDRMAVPASKLIGTYTGFRIPGAGNVAMFMQTTTGLIVCVVLPILLLVGYDMIRRKLYEKKHQSDKDALMAELEELRRIKRELGVRSEE